MLRSIRWARLVGSVCLSGCLLGAISVLSVAQQDQARPASAIGPSSSNPDEDLVVVSEGLAWRPAQFIDGCRAVSVFSVSSGEAIFRGPYLADSHNLVSSDDFTRIVGGPWVGSLENYSELTRPQPGSDSWEIRRVRPHSGGRFTHIRLAQEISPNGELLYIGTSFQGKWSIGEVDLSGIYIDQFDLATLPDPSRSLLIGPEQPRIAIGNRDNSRLHVLTRENGLFTIDPSTMEFDSVRIPLPKIDFARTDEDLEGSQFMTMSVGERFLVTNRWRGEGLNVVDTHLREAWSMPIAQDITITGGVAINHGWENPGLLAMHASDKLVVYRFDPFDRSLEGLEELARIEIPNPVVHLPNDGGSVPTSGAVRWSASGSHLIAVTSHEESEFVVVRVDSCGSSLNIEHYLAACPRPNNLGYDILTANGLLDPPSDFTGNCPLPNYDEFPREYHPIFIPLVSSGS